MAEEIVRGVYGIAMSYVNAFLVADGELTLIDSGLAGRKETILGAVAGLGKQASDLKHIAITHHHRDHTGSLAALVEASGAKVYVHPADGAVVRGEAPAPGPNPSSLLGKVVGPLLARLTESRFEAAKIDQEVNDGDELAIGDGMKVVHAPGHTPGSVAFLTPSQGGVLFVGDAAGNLFGRLGPPFGMFTEDMAQAKESIRKLAELEFEVACFGHGRALNGRANAAFRRLVERLAR